MTNEAQPLRDIRVLITRDDSRSAALRTLLSGYGAESSCLPLFDILPVASTLEHGLQDYRGVIFTSGNAVLHGPAWRQGPLCLAVGPATAQALRNSGVEAVVVPSRTDSEGLLALPLLERVHGQRWLIIKGRGGRQLLQQGLVERGAEVDVLEVYERRPLVYEGQHLDQAIACADAAIVYSGDILRQLVEICPDRQKEHLMQMQLVVPGARVVKMAQVMGFKQAPQPAERMTDDALARALLAAMAGPGNDGRIKESTT